MMERYGQSSRAAALTKHFSCARIELEVKESGDSANGLCKTQKQAPDFFITYIIRHKNKTMEETHGSCCGGTCGGTQDAETSEEACCAESTCSCNSCDVEFNVSEDAKFATLLMLVPMLTLSAFNMMGLL